MVITHTARQAASPSFNTTTLSATGRQWVLRPADDAAVHLLARQTGLPAVLARILHTRYPHFTAADAVQFLAPQLNDLPDPMHLKDMDKAVTRLMQAITNNEKIAIFGDYDVDGSCASALLIKYFSEIGNVPVLYIPDRLSEGYGPNPRAMEKLKAQGVQVVITVDCGSLAFEAMETASSLGLDVIITDHHQTKTDLPPCAALVNPNRLDETSPCTMLAGVGVAFYLVMALNRALRDASFFNADRPEPALKNLLDLVALATVCDMVPLTGVNRVLVQRGLHMASLRQNAGLHYLAHAARCDEVISAYSAGFQLGPRINAGGRIGACDTGARLLSVTNTTEAQALALRLDALNEERKQIEQAVLEKAMAQALETFIPDDYAVVVANTGWHAGVVGIVASRLKEKFHRPTFVIAVADGVGKGSGRSVSGVDLGRAVIDGGHLLVAGGGHAMAAGITVEMTKLDLFKHHLNTHIKKQVAGKDDIFTPTTKLDGMLTPAAVSPGLMENLARLEPYGTGNSEPKFAFSGVRVAFAKPVGADGNHLQLTLKGDDGSQLKAIAFKAMESELGPCLLQHQNRPLSVCGVLRQEKWQGNSYTKLQIADAMPGVWQPGV